MVGLGWAEARRVSTGSEAVTPAAARRNARRSTLVGVWSMTPPLRGAMRAWNDRAPRNTTTRPPIEAGPTIASASMAVNLIEKHGHSELDFGGGRLRASRGAPWPGS